MRPTLLLALVLAGAAYGQDVQGPITLSRAVEFALERNYLVRQAQNNVERDQAGVLSAYGNFMPTVSASAGWSGGQQYFNGVALGDNDVRSFNTSLSANMTIFDGFANTSQLSIANSTVSGTEQTLTRTRQSVVAQTMRFYYEVLRTRRLLEVAQQTMEYSSRQLERVQETARLGSASLVNVYQQQAQVGQDEVSFVIAQNNYDVAKSNLVAYLALDVQSDPEIRDVTIPLEIDSSEFRAQEARLADFSGLVSNAFSQRPDYESSKLTLRAAESGVTAARSGYYPSLTARLSYSMNGRTILENAGGQPRYGFVTDNLGNVTAGIVGFTPSTAYSSEFSNFTDSKSLNWGLSLSFPLFSGFRTSESVERAKVGERNAELLVQEKERTIQVEVRQAALQLQAAQKTYEAAMKSLKFQEQNLRVNQEKYNVGSGTLLELLLAQNNYNSAMTSKINAVYQYLNAKSQLDLATGSIAQ